MRLQYSPAVGALLASAALALASAYVVTRRSDRQSARWYAIAMIAMALWAGSSALALTLVDPFLTRILLGAHLGFAAATTATWCLFCLSYSGYEKWIAWPLVTAFAAAVVGITLLAVTNPYHDLVYVTSMVDQNGEWVSLTHTWGPGLWVSVAIVYLIHGISNAALYTKFRRSRNLYRRFTVLLLLASLTIWLANILSVTRLSPTPHMMFVPIVFLFWGLVGLVVFVSIRSARLLPVGRLMSILRPGSDTVLPLARDFVVEEIDSGIIILDDEDHIVDVNTMGKQMLGTKERLVGKRIQDVVHLEAYLDGDPRTATVREQLWVESEDGDEHCYDVTVSEISGDAGTVVGQAVVMNDITSQKQREKTLRDREQELQTLKQVFSRVLRHNIRNDINVIRGHAELLDAQYENGVSSHAEKIVEKADALATTSQKTRIIDRVVGSDSERVEIDVADLIEEGLADCTRSYPDAVIDVDRPGGLTVNGNEFLSAAIENAVENGIVHSRSDPPTVDIDVRAVGDTVELRVTDNGPGIPDHELDVLDSGTETSLVHASGIGLWLIDRIVASSGGDVSFENTADGAVTIISLERAA